MAMKFYQQNNRVPVASELSTSPVTNDALFSYVVLCHKYYMEGFQAAAVMRDKTPRKYLNTKFHLKIK